MFEALQNQALLLQPALGQDWACLEHQLLMMLNK